MTDFGWVDWLLIYGAAFFVFWFGWFLRGACDAGKRADEVSEQLEQILRREP
jgi:hypothetical protein